jgi:hypothetical protein
MKDFNTCLSPIGITDPCGEAGELSYMSRVQTGKILLDTHLGFASSGGNSCLSLYDEALRDLPPSGSGCHPAMLGVANYGRMAKLEPERVFSDIRNNLKPGKRRVLDAEIKDAVEKAFECQFEIKEPACPVSRIDGQPFFRHAVAVGHKILCEHGSLADMSNMPLPENSAEQAILFLEKTYALEDYVYMGWRESFEEQIMLGNLEIQECLVKTAKDWIDHIRTGGDALKHCHSVCINSLTGTTGQTQKGTLSFRADTCVSNFRYVLAELDCYPKGWEGEGNPIPKPDQEAFWASMIANDVPVRCVIDSANKSLHGWIQVDCRDYDDWVRTVKCDLFPNLLVHWGVDRACSNPSRLSRMPGHLRVETGNYQKLLYLGGAHE